jgi:ATP-dependent helicase HrpB
VREDLVLLAMSATLDAGPIAAFLDAPVVSSEGRTFPVELAWLPRPDERRVEDVVADGVRRVLAEGPGDVLVFLPGVREIRRTAERLATAGAEVVELYGDLPPERQDAALQPGSRRRVVLATNVAETSVTVPGVTVVVDSGLVRQPRFDASVGLDRLTTRRICRASAAQRAGRAGRTAPGRCLRLWTEREHAGMAEHDPPEIARVSVAGPVLQLLAWGRPDPAEFGWLEVPPAEALAHATTLLEELGATAGGRLTPLGTAMSTLPVHPRLARLVLEGHRLGRLEEAALAAALLSERDPLHGHHAERTSPSDVWDRVELLQEGRGHPGGRRHVQRVASQLARLTRRTGPPERTASIEEALGRAVLAAWPDRVAARRGPGSPRARMTGGTGVVLHERSAVRDAELFVAVDVRPRSGEHQVHLASEVRRDWLPTDTRTVLELDEAGGRVQARRVVGYRDLELESHPASPDPVEAAALLEQAAASHLDRVQPDTRAWRELLARLGSAHHWLPERFPAADDALLRSLLPWLCATRRTFAELRAADWTSALWGQVGWELQQALDRVAPERLEVPSGSRIRLAYTPGEAPVLAVRMQELFGSRDTPSVAEGRVPVRLHLLAPNQRPQQITDDLAGFWERTWPQVRKELRARYPKHAWPEDPVTAEPLRGAKRRRR